jgi:carbonic anhydrase
MALAELEVGNKRFVAGRRTRSVDTGKDPELRAKLAKGQSPFAVVVTCSDSRVPDNIVFDQEPGRLFTVREAGNSPDLQGIASIDYAVEHLGAKVVVIMGHTSCGAVQAVYAARGKPLPGNLWAFQAAMAGLVESAPQNPKEEQRFYLERLVETNARRQAQNLVDRSDMVRTLAKLGKLWVVPAVYSLKTGEARLLDRVQVGGDATASAGGHH